MAGVADRVVAPVVPENERSRRILQRLGFRIDRPITLAERVHDLWVRA
jgi:RimJ/RimL family protein N-acetyltransferase